MVTVTGDDTAVPHPLDVQDGNVNVSTSRDLRARGEEQNGEEQNGRMDTREEQKRSRRSRAGYIPSRYPLQYARSPRGGTPRTVLGAPRTSSQPAATRVTLGKSRFTALRHRLSETSGSVNLTFRQPTFRSSALSAISAHSGKFPNSGVEDLTGPGPRFRNILCKVEIIAGPAHPVMFRGGYGNGR